MSISNTEDLEQYDLYRVVKLATVETIMCVLVDEGKDEITFEHPVLVEWVKVMKEGNIESELSYMPYCPFASDRTFVISNSQIQHINNMDKNMIRPYLNLVHGKEDIEIPKG
jgi:hypothetical protein